MQILFLCQNVWRVIDQRYEVQLIKQFTNAQRENLTNSRKKDFKTHPRIYQLIDPPIFEKTEKTSIAKGAWDIMIKTCKGVQNSATNFERVIWASSKEKSERVF